jgi:hypothetical protein
LGYNTVQSIDNHPTVRRNIIIFRFEEARNKHEASSKHGDAGDMSIQNVG